MSNGGAWATPKGPPLCSVSVLAGGWLGFVMEGINHPLLSTLVPSAEWQKLGKAATLHLFWPLKIMG